MRTRTLAAGLVAITLILVGCQSAPQRPDTIVQGDLTFTKAHLSWLIEQQRERRDIPGLSIALVRRGKNAPGQWRSRSLRNAPKFADTLGCNLGPR